MIFNVPINIVVTETPNTPRDTPSTPEILGLNENNDPNN